jgi:hypothetical protein
MDLQTDAVLEVFQRGLLDRYSSEVRFTAVFVVHLLMIDLQVRHAALLVSVAYLAAADAFNCQNPSPFSLQC